MRRLLAAVVGTRPDLKLRDRWWHRLALVAYVALISSVAILVTSRQGGVSAVELSPSQRVLIADLLSFSEGFKGSGNPATAFANKDGWLLVDTDADRPSWFDVAEALVKEQFVCKAGGRVFGATGSQNDIIEAQYEGVGISPMPNRAGEVPDVVKSVCWGPLERVPTAAIVKFRPTRVAVLTKWFRNVLIAGASAGGLAMLVALLYYRVFVYVAFGPNSSSP